MLVFTILANASAVPRVTVVVVPDLRAHDLENIAVVARNIRSTTAGFIVCRAGGHGTAQLRPDGRDRLSSLLLTIAAGARTVGPAGSIMAASSPPNSLAPAQVPAVLWSSILRFAKEEPYPVHTGILGDLVHRAGMTTASIADAHTPYESALSMLLTADSSGNSDTSAGMLMLSKRSACSPGGVETDVTRLENSWMSLPQSVGLCAITIWSLRRADHSAPKCLPTAASAHRRKALDDVNEILTSVVRKAIPRGGYVLLLAPGPAVASPPIDRLAPFLMAGHGVIPGALSTYSTNVRAVAVNTDVLPTILKLLAIHSRVRLVGRYISGDHSPLNLREYRSLHRMLVLRAISQQKFGGLPTLQLILLIACIAAIILNRASIYSSAACVLATLPVALLLLPLLPTASVYAQGIEIAICFALSGLAGYFWPTRATLVVCSLTGILVITCVADLLTGCHLQRIAWMSYSVMEAARFFGVGGEYTGATLGSAIVATACLNQRSSKFLLISITAIFALSILMAWPAAGAKVGALPTGICVTGLALVAFSNKRIKLAYITAAAAAVAMLLTILVVVDKRRTMHESQLGRAFQGHAGGTILQIAERKLAMSGYLLTHSIWALVLVAALITVWQATQRLGSTGKALATISWLGAFCCLIFNDAGPAIASAFVVPVTAYLVTKCAQTSGCQVTSSHQI